MVKVSKNSTELRKQISIVISALLDRSSCVFVYLCCWLLMIWAVQELNLGLKYILSYRRSRLILSSGCYYWEILNRVKRTVVTGCFASKVVKFLVSLSIIMIFVGCRILTNRTRTRKYVGFILRTQTWEQFNHDFQTRTEKGKENNAGQQKLFGKK